MSAASASTPTNFDDDPDDDPVVVDVDLLDAGSTLRWVESLEPRRLEVLHQCLDRAWFERKHAEARAMLARLERERVAALVAPTSQGAAAHVLRGVRGYHVLCTLTGTAEWHASHGVSTPRPPTGAARCVWRDVGGEQVMVEHGDLEPPSCRLTAAPPCAASGDRPLRQTSRGEIDTLTKSGT